MPNHANIIYYFIYPFAWNAFIFYSYSHSTHGPFRFNSKKKNGAQALDVSFEAIDMNIVNSKLQLLLLLRIAIVCVGFAFGLFMPVSRNSRSAQLKKLILECRMRMSHGLTRPRRHHQSCAKLDCVYHRLGVCRSCRIRIPYSRTHPSWTWRQFFFKLLHLQKTNIYPRSGYVNYLFAIFINFDLK